MLSVAIFAIIVTIVVTAYLRSAINQQSQANTYDFSTRAYYAAESGVQDAVRAVNADPTLAKDSCDTFVGGAADGVLSGDLGLKYTCQLIDATPDNISFYVRENQNATVRLLPATAQGGGNYDMVVRWAMADNTTSGFVARAEENAHFPAQSAWMSPENQPFHPALRVTLLPYSSGSAANQRVAFLNPLSTGLLPSAASQGSVTLSSSDTSSQQEEKLVQHARCYDAGEGNSFNGYLCEQIVRMSGYDLNAHTLFTRIRSLYGATAVQLELRKDGQTLPITGAAVTVDVTGNAGNTFRRVRQTYNLQNGIMFDTLPEAAVVGGDGICKLYSITNDAAGFTNSGTCFTP